MTPGVQGAVLRGKTALVLTHCNGLFAWWVTFIISWFCFLLDLSHSYQNIQSNTFFFIFCSPGKTNLMAAILFTTSLWLVRILTAFNEENVWPWMEHWLLWGHVLEQSTCIILTEIGKIRYLSVTIVLKHPDSFTFLLCSISLLVK